MAKSKSEQRDLEQIGARLKAARDRAGLGQKDIATVCGVSVQAVSQWESGKNEAPYSCIKQIARRTGTDLAWVLTGSVPADALIRGGSDVPLFGIDELKDIEKARQNVLSTHTTLRPVGAEAFAHVVRDKSNEPVLQVGDVCVFDPKKPAEPGMFVMALVGKERMPVIRRLEQRTEGEFVLVPANSQWPPKVISSKKDGEIIGTLVEFTRPF